MENCTISNYQIDKILSDNKKDRKNQTVLPLAAEAHLKKLLPWTDTINQWMACIN